MYGRDFQMKIKKVLAIAILVLVLIFLAIFWWRYYFVFGEGVKAGNLNFIVRKGVMFKTWEGRLIQSGFKTPTPGAMQSNEFDFSVAGDSVAQKLEQAGGKFVELRYREYLHPLPWRGMSRYVVTGIVGMENEAGKNGLPF
jgi:hypothetical protein